MRRRLPFAGPQSRFQFPAQALARPLEPLVFFLQPPNLSLLPLDFPLGPV
jgi:hypothetical protein